MIWCTLSETVVRELGFTDQNELYLAGLIEGFGLYTSELHFSKSSISDVSNNI